MGTTMCIPRRRDDCPVSYFGIPVSTLALCEERVVRQSTNYVHGIPILLQDVAFYWDSQSKKIATKRTTGAVPSDSMWITAAERTINEFVKRSKLLFSDKYMPVCKDNKKGKGSNDTSRVFERPFHTIVGKTPLCAPHFLAILTLFLRKLPEPLVVPLFVRQSEDILTNNKLNEEEKASLLYKANRDTFMLLYSTEYTVFQFLKQLLQRHCAELTASEVEILVRSMVRDPAEHFVQLILQQVRSVVGPIPNAPIGRVSSGNSTVSKAQFEGILRRSNDEINDVVNVSCPPSESYNGKMVGAGGHPKENISTGSLELTSVRNVLCTDQETNQEKERGTFIDEEREARHMASQASAARYVDSTELSYSTLAESEELTNEDYGESLLVVAKNAEAVAGDESGQSNDEHSNVIKMKVAELCNESFSSSEGEEKEEQEGEHSARSKHIESKECDDLKIAVLLRTPDVSTVSLLSQGNYKSIPEQMKYDVPEDAASSGSENENAGELIVTSSDLVKFCTTTVQPKDLFSHHSINDVSHVSVKSADEQRQQKRQRRLTASGLDTQMLESQVVKQVVTVEPLVSRGTGSPAFPAGKESRGNGAKWHTEQHPHYAALMGAKRLFIGKENLPPKQVLLGDQPISCMEHSVGKKAHSYESVLCPMKQMTQDTHKMECDIGNPPLVLSKPLGVALQGGMDDVTNAEREYLDERLIQPLMAQIGQLTARYEALEQRVRSQETPVSLSSDTLRTIKRSEEGVVFLKNVLQEMVENNLGITEDILELQRQVQQQRERLEGHAVDNKCWFDNLMDAKEATLETQRRCASLEKAQNEDRQSYRQMSLKLKDLANKLEHVDKKNLDLKIDLSTVQRQALLMREKLMSDS